MLLLILSTANLNNKINNIKAALAIPNLPTSYAIASNFSYNGVVYTSSVASNEEIFPTQLESPTTTTIILPSPDSTLVPLSITGDDTSCLPHEFY